METILILYDIQHFEWTKTVERTVKLVEQDHGIKIYMDIIDSYELLGKLKTNPNYNFVILHIGQEGKGAYSQVNKCRTLSNAVLVAESSICPQGQSEVLKYFDDYVGSILKGENLTDLLKKYAFISGKK